MSDAVFVIGEGTVTALAGGPLSLADMGERTTERVSRIEFNSEAQLWQVSDPAYPVSDYRHLLAEFDDYDRALAWEIDHFNRRLSLSVDQFISEDWVQ